VIFQRSHVVRGEEPVRNGLTGKVVSIDERTGRTRVRMQDDGRIVTVRLEKEENRQPIAPAYAQVIDKFQGHEAEVTQIIAGRGSMNRGYTQATRAIYESHVYLAKDIHGQAPIKTVGEAWQVSEQKETALSRLREIKEQGPSPEVESVRLEPEPDLDATPDLDPAPPLDDERLEEALSDLQQDWLRDYLQEMEDRKEKGFGQGVGEDGDMGL